MTITENKVVKTDGKLEYLDCYYIASQHYYIAFNLKLGTFVLSGRDDPNQMPYHLYTDKTYERVRSTTFTELPNGGGVASGVACNIVTHYKHLTLDEFKALVEAKPKFKDVLNRFGAHESARSLSQYRLDTTKAISVW